MNVKNLVLLPEALVAAAAVLVLLGGRLGWFKPARRRYLPAAVAVVAIVVPERAAAVETETANPMGAA